jgi:hypothetical protein
MVRMLGATLHEERSMQASKQRDRIRDVKRIFEEQGFGNAEMLEGWDGRDLGDLAEFLSEEEYQTLLDELEGPDEDRSR